MPVPLFDLIISNPPYIPSAEIATLQPEVRDFDPRAALDGGADGLDFYRMIAAQAKPFLKPDGKIMLEFGDGQAEAIREIFENEKWIVEAVKEDYCHRARILIARIDPRSSVLVIVIETDRGRGRDSACTRQKTSTWKVF